MKVTVEPGTGLERIVEVEMDSIAVDAKLNSIAKEIALSVNVPGGYRKLKPKIARVKRLYRKNILAQASSDLLEESLREAIEQENLKTVGMPRMVDMGEVKFGQPYVYKFSVEVHPQIDNPDYLGLTVPVMDVTPTDEEVDAALESLRTKNVSLRDCAGEKLAEGLQVTLTVTPKVDDEQTLGALTISSREFELAEGRLPLSLRTALLEHEVGDTFELDESVAEMPVYGGPEYNDESYRWEVRVESAAQKIVPELNDDFAMQARGLKSLLALRGDLREQLTQEKRKEAARTVRLALTQQLLHRNRIMLPMRTIMDMFQERMKPVEENIKQYRESLGDDFVNNMLASQRREQLGGATSETAIYFIAQSIADLEKIDSTDEDVEARLAEQAEAQGVSVAYLKGKLGEDKLDGVKFDIRMDQVFEIVERRGVPQPLELYTHLMDAMRKRQLMRRRCSYLRRVRDSRNLRRRMAA